MPAEPEPHWVLDAVARYERSLILYASRLLGDAERARDVVQDTFLKLCGQRREDLRERLAEWLGRMSRLGDDQVSTCTSPEPDPAESAERRESAALVLDYLDGLPDNQREVIRLKFQNGFSYREISRISGHSISNVGFLIHTGLKTLRKRLADGLPAEA
jgi:RNA polymerase sigma-70 factor (ECF subfamily)